MNRPLKKITGRGLVGFTFVEIMMTMTLFMILAGVGVGQYFSYYNFSLVNADFTQITKALHDARFKAMKNPNNSDYGIHLDTNAHTLTVFRDTYTPSHIENVVTQLEQLNITALNLQPNPGTTADIVFEKLTGRTQNTGSFTASRDEHVFTFTINKQGAFE